MPTILKVGGETGGLGGYAAVMLAVLDVGSDTATVPGRRLGVTR